MSEFSKYQAQCIQRALREITGIALVIDGALGEQSLKALNEMAATLALPASKDFSGEAFNYLLAYVGQRFVKEQAFTDAACSLGVEEAAVRAVAQVESVQAGYQKDGRLTILFERHWFYPKLKEALKRKTTQEHVLSVLGVSMPESSDRAAKILALVAQREPDLCNPVSGGYTTGQEWDRLSRAAAYDTEAAYSAASYGSFQIMGFNHVQCGYNTAVSMMVDFAASETVQFQGFVNFIKNDPDLLSALKAKDWAKFAFNYNGKSYAKNKYDVKMKDAYDAFVIELKKK